MSYKRTRAFLAKQSLELSTATPEVIALRLNKMMFTGIKPSAAQNEEFELMWAEKSDAFIKSWQAMAEQTIIANQEMYDTIFKSMFTPWWQMNPMDMFNPKKYNTEVLKVINKGLEPIHKIATANMERLNK